MIRQRIQALRASDRGFTLIELLIVIVVLGILASIVVFGVSTFRADAVAACTSANTKTVSVAADAYTAKTGTAMANPPTAAEVTTLVTQGYLKSAPVAC